ncbi:branched-chain amino acid ABC transporter permease [Humidisolicoccus flavus]|uniref:branched-chain amino acid ABC transporter permease n=1 Tax=Humidisolicoccus flavus TaxID=3111414 RepID=UPI0032474095
MDFVSLIENAMRELVSPAAAAYVLAAIGLSVHFGYAGLLNFGMAGFMAIGAYGYAIASLLLGFNALMAALFAIILAIIFSFILGIPTLRLRGDYLAIVTIAAAEIVRYVVMTTGMTPITRGSQGMSGYQTDFNALNPLPAGNYGFWVWEAGATGTWMRIVAWSIVILVTLLVFFLMRSPWGRVLKGIREDEDAVRSLGKNVWSYKMQALILGGVIGAVAGIIFVLPSNVQPVAFMPTLTFFVWTALLLGGAATVFGPIVGGVLFWVLFSLTQGIVGALQASGVFGALPPSQAGQLRFVLVGIALMLIVIYRPQGIFGNKKELSFNV